MAKHYLDANGLLYFWTKIKDYVSSQLADYLPANGTAANATKATQDGSGNVIETTYQKIADIPAAITASEMDAVLGEESEETTENTNE